VRFELAQPLSLRQHYINLVPMPGWNPSRAWASLKIDVVGEFLGMQVKKRESLSPDQLPRRRAAFPSSLRAISTVSKFREHGKYGAVSYRSIIKSLRCEKITPTKLDQ
jgi:hypothetical protein